MASEGFFERVYEVVEQIPEGMVATYGQVALLAGRPRSVVKHQLVRQQPRVVVALHRVQRVGRQFLARHALGEVLHDGGSGLDAGIGSLTPVPEKSVTSGQNRTDFPCRLLALMNY